MLVAMQKIQEVAGPHLVNRDHAQLFDRWHVRALLHLAGAGDPAAVFGADGLERRVGHALVGEQSCLGRNDRL